jgi:hypothetical protein
MISWLTNATKKRVIREIRKILYDHPRYRQDHENVQNKYAFSQRPQRGVIVNSTSGDRVRLSADNYIGQLSSFVMLTTVEDKPGTSIEWVRENFNILEQTSPQRDVFPSPPGVYFIDIKEVPDEGKDTPGQFTVEPILTIHDEPLILFQTSADTEAQISREHLYPGSVRLWLDGRKQLIRRVDYEVNEESGAVTFLKTTPTGSAVHADYRYRTPTQGPYLFKQGESNESAIPGAVIAFGERAQIGDCMAIVVTDERTDVAKIYGGKYEISFDLIAFVRNDAEDREKLSDYIIHSFLDIQNRLGFEGLELLDISPGGENEEIYNATDNTYYYESNISLSLRVDWETHLPLPVVVSRVELTSREMEMQHGWLDGSAETDLLEQASSILETLPVIIGKEVTFERIR